MTILSQVVAVVFISILLAPSLPSVIPNHAEEASATTILFADNYTNAGWHQAGSEITVNSLFFPGVVKFNNEAGGGGFDDERVVKKLPSTLPVTGWTADFKYKFSASNIPRSRIFDLTTTSADPFSQSPSNSIIVEHGFEINQLVVASGSASGSISAGIPISPNVQYYVRLERTPTQLELSVFSDPARTMNVSGSPVTLAIKSTDFSNLNFLQHDGCLECGPARTLTAQIDNTNIYNGSQTLFKTQYHVPVWTQIGSEITANGLGFPVIAKFNNEAGGGGFDDERILKKLSAPLPVSWTANFDYKFTASSLVRGWIFVLSSTSADPATQDASHIIMVEHGFDANQLMIDRSWTGPNSTSSAGIPISLNTQYYVSLEKTPTHLILSVFSDKARTHQIAGSPVTLGISPSDYNNNLNFIQHDGCTPCGPARTLTAQIDNTIIFAP